MDLIVVTIILGLLFALRTKELNDENIIPAFLALEVYKKTKKNKFKLFEASNER